MVVLFRSHHRTDARTDALGGAARELEPLCRTLVCAIASGSDRFITKWE